MPAIFITGTIPDPLPMPPNYVSTVDSGNMAGHLITLKQGFSYSPESRSQCTFFDGLLVTLEIVQEKMGSRKGTEKLEG